MFSTPPAATVGVSVPSHEDGVSVSFRPINIKSYLYHSISGFDLYKLVSILNSGILSKESASRLGVSIASSGAAENGSDRVSLSAPEVFGLSGAGYADDHLSFVIEPRGLSAFKPQSSNALFHEMQVYDEVPSGNIIGIVIPTKYMSMKFTELPLFDNWNKEILAINMNNLNSFLQKEFSCAILSDKDVKQKYDETFQNVEWNTLQEDYLDHERKVERLYKNLNSSIFSFIHNVYKKKLGKPDVDIVDIIKYHARDKCPLYNIQGDLIVSQAQELGRCNNAIQLSMEQPPLVEEKKIANNYASHSSRLWLSPPGGERRAEPGFGRSLHFHLEVSEKRTIPAANHSASRDLRLDFLKNHPQPPSQRYVTMIDQLIQLSLLPEELKNTVSISDSLNIVDITKIEFSEKTPFKSIEEFANKARKMGLKCEADQTHLLPDSLKIELNIDELELWLKTQLSAQSHLKGNGAHI